MRYYLQPALLSPPKPLKITKSEFDDLAAARQTLVAAFPLEENFDLLVSNFLELETAALSIATTEMVRNNIGGYQEAFETRAILNRRAVNLLTAARLFVDQLPQGVAACGQDPELVRAELAARYDEAFEFRFMEALRNHVQHSGLAVHSASLSSRWLPRGTVERQENTATGLVLRRMLEQDKKFKRKVLAECPEQVDVLHAARVYIEALGSVHEVARRAVAAAVEAARHTAEGAIRRYTKFSKSSALGLTAYAASEGHIKQRVLVLMEWEKVRAALERRNGSLVNLRCRFVTDIPTPDGA